MGTAIWTAGIALGLLTSSAWGKVLQIGYINSERILAEYKEFALIQEKIRKMEQQWEQEAKARREEIQRLEDTYESQKLLLSDERRLEMEREINRKYEEYQKFINEILGPEGKRAQKIRELSKPIYDRINAILVQIAQEEGLDFIFDISVPAVVYARPEYDLTDKVLEYLNKEK